MSTQGRLKTAWFAALATVAICTVFVTSEAQEPRPAQASDTKGFVQLFDGKTLKGWKVHPEGTGTWKVENGILIGSGPISHLFSERADYKNFVFRIEAKISNKGNSGQLFRSQFGKGFPKGYEAQINSTHADTQRTGSLVSLASFTEQTHKPDEWFTQEVIGVDGAADPLVPRAANALARLNQHPEQAFVLRGFVGL